MRSKDVELAEKLGDKSSEYYSLCNVEQIEPRDFAKKSKFHGQIMEDGYVFNPYIHRRWLPARYKNLRAVARICEISLEKKIKDMGYKYSIKTTLEELHKLELLKKTSPEAFDERKRIFTPDVIKTILLQDLKNILIYSSCKENGHGGKDFFDEMYYYIHGIIEIKGSDCEMMEELIKNPWTGKYDSVSRVWPVEFLAFLRKRINLLEKADTYFEITRALRDVPIKANYVNYIPLEMNLEVNEKFIKAYHLAGAYYTLKNDIMFEGKEVNGLKGAEACDYIREMLNSGATAEEFDKLLL